MKLGSSDGLDLIQGRASQMEEPDVSFSLTATWSTCYPKAKVLMKTKVSMGKQFH